MSIDRDVNAASEHIRAAVEQVRRVISTHRPIGDLAHLGGALKMLVDAEFELCLCRHTERQKVLASLDDHRERLAGGGPDQTPTSIE